MSGGGARLIGAEPRLERREAVADQLLDSRYRRPPAASPRRCRGPSGPPCPFSAIAPRLNCEEQSPSSASARNCACAALVVAGGVFAAAPPGNRRGPAERQQRGASSRGTRRAADRAAAHGALLSAPRSPSRPCRPAVHTEIRPRFALASAGEDLGERAEDARAGGGEGMAEGDAAALHVEPGAVDAAERRRQAQHVAAVFRRLPRLERAQQLRRERLVDLVVVEVLQREPGVAAAWRARRRWAPSAVPPCRRRNRPPTPCRNCR